MSLPFIATYEDVLTVLEAFIRGRAGKADCGSVQQETIRGCVETALREIVATRDWKCFKRIWRVPLVAAQSTGTIVYAASGDNFDYEVTLTGDTWPSWAAQGEILIEGLVCEVSERKSDTVLTLKSPRVPSADASAVAFTLGRSWYVLPAEFAAAWSPAEKNAWFNPARYISMDDMHLLTKFRTLTGTVRNWSIGPAPDYYGSQALYVYPWASAVAAEDLLMKFRPRSLVVSGKDAWNSVGTVSVSEDGTTVTGSGTSFRSLMEGSIIRFSDTSSDAPTSQSGKYPYVFQQSVASVASSTSLTLSAASDSTLSGVKYVVSDPVDMISHMYDAFLWNCKTQLAYEVGMDWPQNIQRRYQASLHLAKVADSQMKQPQIAGRGRVYAARLADDESRDEVGG